MLEECNILDPKVSKPNRHVGSPKKLSGKVDITPRGLVLHCDSMTQEDCTANLDMADYLKMLLSGAVVVPSKSPSGAGATLPPKGQRQPTSARTKQIKQGYENGDVPPNHTEVVRATFSGAECNHKTMTVTFGDQLSKIKVFDGAGRSTLLFNEVKILEETMDVDKAIQEVASGFPSQVLVVARLDGDKPINTLKSFELTNSLIKRISAPTKVAIRVAKMKLEKERPTMDSLSAPVWIAQSAYEEFNKNPQGSFLVNMPFTPEGEKPDMEFFDRRLGNATSLVTALGTTYTGHLLHKSGIDITELPKVLDFAFREWYEMCPVAADKKESHIYSTLGLSVIIAISIRVWKITGYDSEAFQKKVEDVVAAHFALYKKEYLNSKSKKMTPDSFWFEYSAVAGKLFNSGARNTKVAVDSFSAVMNTINL